MRCEPSFTIEGSLKRNENHPGNEFYEAGFHINADWYCRPMDYGGKMDNMHIRYNGREYSLTLWSMGDQDVWSVQLMNMTDMKEVFIKTNICKVDELEREELFTLCLNMAYTELTGKTNYITWRNPLRKAS